MSERAPHVRDRRERRARRRASELAVDHAGVADRVARARETRPCARCARPRSSAASASSASNTSRSSAVWCARDARLGRDVPLEAAVPVEMVGRDREQDRDARMERLRARELERRHLGDEHVDVVARPRRSAGGRCCRPRPRCAPDASSIAAISVVTVVLPLVPVTATIGASVRSAARSISLRTGTVAARAAAERRVVEPHQRARHDEIGRADDASDRLGGRAPRRGRRRARAHRRPGAAYAAARARARPRAT